MYLRRLRLSGFRNHVDTDLPLEPGTVAITGGNGQGKSSLLEAAHMLSVGKSSRTSNYSELANHQVATEGGRAHILGVFVEGEATSRIQFDMQFDQPFGGNDIRNASSKREWRIDAVSQKPIDVVGRANVVLFEVADLDLVLGGAAIRRRYLNILISQYDAEYKRALLRLDHVRRSRVALLHGARAGADIGDDIVFWDERFRDESVKITLTRRDVVDQLAQLARPIHSALSGGESMEIRYTPALGPKSREADMANIDAAGLSELIEQSLAEVHQREVGVGRMLIGPHLDDFEIRLGDYRARNFASRGQARTVALALRLAEADMVQQHTQRTPIVLFDDVMSEMDTNRRALILERTSDFDQTLMTATDEASLGGNPNDYAQRVHVHDGTATTAE